jgi:hypothetical protein
MIDTDRQAASFAPLKGTAGGLGIILQVCRLRQVTHTQIVTDEAKRAEDFLYSLRRIKFQAAVIADNPTYDLNSESTRNLVEEKSRDLMTAVIKFFNGALIFSKNFAGELTNIQCSY